MAFKVRGGVWYMSQMKAIVQKRGVITASTGNHAQSIAYAGLLFEIPVTVVMPKGSPSLKIESTEDFGAKVVLHGSYFEEAREYAEALARKKKLQFVHGINEPILYEGVGSMHLEVIQELPDVDIVVNPIGGGSGAASACIVYKTLNPRIQVIGVQAEGAPALYQSWKRGSIVSTEGVKTKAEGLATSTAYELPLKILRQNLDDITVVSDDELSEGVRTIFLATRQVAELSGAASTAAAMRMKGLMRGKKVVLMLTGGNIDPEKFGEIINRSKLR